MTSGDLCPELAPVLASELAAGNAVAYTDSAPSGPEAVFVMLKKPFARGESDTPPNVEYELVNDPHWWLAEYRCVVHHHVIACQFA
jgi:hypothetical protein